MRGSQPKPRLGMATKRDSRWVGISQRRWGEKQQSRRGADSQAEGASSRAQKLEGAHSGLHHHTAAQKARRHHLAFSLGE